MVGWGVMGATVLWKKLLDQASVAIYLILNGKGTDCVQLRLLTVL